MAQPTKVLLVDDDVDFVAINRAFLDKAGFTVVVAHDGREGLAKARVEKPDIVVLDYMMAKPTEGAFVAQVMKNDLNLRSIPIILITAIGTVEPWRDVQKDDYYLPVEVFLDKPVSPHRLAEEIGRLVPN